MIAEQIVITDIDARQWINLVRLFAGNGDRKWRILVCLMEGDQCLKAIHSEKGVLWRFRFPGNDHLEALRQAMDVDTVLCLPHDSLQEIFYHAQARVGAFDSYVEQLLAIVTGVKGVLDRVAVWYPQKPFELRLPTYRSLAKNLGKLWPDGRTIGLFVFEGESVHTSVILGKEDGEINLFTTLDAFGMSEKTFDWRHGYKTLAEMIAQRYAPLHAALFIEYGCFREMRAGRRPLSFLKLSEKRDRALIYPRPARLRWLLWAARTFKRL